MIIVFDYLECLSATQVIVNRLCATHTIVSAATHIVYGLIQKYTIMSRLYAVLKL